jgi:arsenite-transporting ATPase
MQEARFNAALAALSDPTLTTVVLVTRPDPRPMQEAARTSDELRALGLTNQRLAINGVFHRQPAGATRGRRHRGLGREAMGQMPDALRACRATKCPCGPSTRWACRPARLAGWGPYPPRASPRRLAPFATEPLAALADELAAKGHGLIMVMGKGGVGKTTIAAALAVGLVQRGPQRAPDHHRPGAHLAASSTAACPG